MAVHASLSNGNPSELDGALGGHSDRPAHDSIAAAFGDPSETDLAVIKAQRLRGDLLHWLSWTPESVKQCTRIAQAVEYLETLELPNGAGITAKA